MEILNCILLVVFLMYLVYDTSVIVEYSKLFRLKFTKFAEFEEFRKTSRVNDITYHDYLLLKYPNFLIKLVTCPICLGVWAALIICVINGLNVLNVGWVSILIWLGYFGLVKGIKKLNE